MLYREEADIINEGISAGGSARACFAASLERALRSGAI
jgi:hypothetical protein